MCRRPNGKVREVGYIYIVGTKRGRGRLKKYCREVIRQDNGAHLRLAEDMTLDWGI